MGARRTPHRCTWQEEGLHPGIASGAGPGLRGPRGRDPGEATELEDFGGGVQERTGGKWEERDRALVVTFCAGGLGVVGLSWSGWSGSVESLPHPWIRCWWRQVLGGGTLWRPRPPELPPVDPWEELPVESSPRQLLLPTVEALRLQGAASDSLAKLAYD